MSGVRSRDTSPERRVRSFLHQAGFRFRLHRRSLPGSPDIVLSRYRVALFVNGCFWHQHPGCKKAALPKSNQAFWIKKLQQNQERDAKAVKALSRSGWRIRSLWECEINERTLGKLAGWIARGEP
ncbi:MAG TPA: very short patch repair endonuclease [Thermoanaerobaculia bacterium]|nr:very short patch repair endonuclease [Thermoanaerobaculia bacterium]